MNYRNKCEPTKKKKRAASETKNNQRPIINVTGGSEGKEKEHGATGNSADCSVIT